MNPQYQTPVVTDNSSNSALKLSNNQLSLNPGDGRIELGLHPHFFICQNCGYIGDTNITGSINWIDCLACCCFSGLYQLYTIITLKDYYTCMEVIHTCPKCSKFIGNYRTI